MRFANRYLWALLLFQAFLGHPLKAADCTLTMASLNRIIQRNRFQTRRDFVGYINYFPDSFLKQLGDLGPEGHWVDAGSGEGQAIADFFSPKALTEIETDPLIRPIVNKSIEQKPRATGISYKMEGDIPSSPKAEFRIGRLFENIATDEIAKADIITDLYGVATYSPRFEQVLSKYHAILKTGGKAYIFLGYIEKPYSGEWVENNFHEAPFILSTVKKANGEKVNLVEWAQAIKGFKANIEIQGPKNKRYPVPTTLVLEKVSENAEIPFLKLWGSDLNTPPTRHYEEVVMPALVQ